MVSIQRLIFFTLTSEEDSSSDFGYFEFDKSGGTIGSANSDTWAIGLKSPLVMHAHAVVGYNQGEYFIEESEGSVYIDESASSIGVKKRARLLHGSSIKVGNLAFRVIVTDESNSILSLIKTYSGSLNSLFEDSDSNDNLLISKGDASPSFHKDSNQYTDIMEYQPMSEKQNKSVDPLVALNASNRKEISTKIDIGGGVSEKDTSVFTSPPSTGISAAFDESPLDKTSIEDLENEVSRISNGSENRATPTSSNFIKASLSGQNNTVTDEVLESMVEAINGLKSIYHSSESYSIKKKVSNIPFQLIEDNPIILNNSTSDTMNMLFSNNTSQVYLSGPSAVKECFDQIKDDHRASDFAVEEALDELMKALSPEVLVKRFERYSSNKGSYNSDEEWAWDMFKKYYNELMTDKQSGFYRLFKELYTQSYDKKIRQLQINSGI